MRRLIAMIGHCDCNNFFVSCERTFRPDLNGKPVVVLSNNDGCIVARSNEAKALGIKMGTPLYQIRNLIERENVTVFSSNYQLYGDMSGRVMSTLRDSVPAIEVYSIDEAFLHLKGIPENELHERGLALAQKIHKSTGIPVSIGIAPTKTLAKITGKLCKKYPALHGCCYMHRPEDIEKVLRTYPIEDVWGIGRRHLAKMRLWSVRTAWDFTQLPAEFVQKQMTITGLRTYRELKGEECIKIEDTTPDKQSICVSRSFAKEMYDINELRSAITTFATAVSEKLRRQNSCTHQITVFIYTNRHREDMPQDYECKTRRLTVATDSTLEICKIAASVLREIYNAGYGYKKAGVIATDLVPKAARQGALFDTIDREKHQRLMKAIDSINNTQGKNTIAIASQSEITAFSNRNHTSPRYTTDWNDIIEVKV